MVDFNNKDFVLNVKAFLIAYFFVLILFMTFFLIDKYNPTLITNLTDFNSSNYTLEYVYVPIMDNGLSDTLFVYDNGSYNDTGIKYCIVGG